MRTIPIPPAHWVKLRQSRRKGSAPAVATPSHPSTTMRNTSCLKTSGRGLRVRKKTVVPRAIAPSAGRPKASAFPSATRSEKAARRSIAIPPAAITAPSALAMTLGCKEAFYFIHSRLDGEDDRVVPGSEHLLACGDYDVSVAQQRPDDRPFWEPHLSEWAAGDAGPLRDPELDHLG